MMKNYTTQHIPKNKRIGKSMMTLVITLLLSGYFVSNINSPLESQVIIDSGSTNSLYDYFQWLFPAFILILGLLLTVVFYRQKEIHELTSEAKIEQEAREEEFWNRWYFRYPVAIFALGIAGTCFAVWHADVRLHGMAILVLNPVVGVISMIAALVKAKEISLVAIIVGVGYLAFQGIAALPVSVAVVCGAIIIAYALSKKRA